MTATRPFGFGDAFGVGSTTFVPSGPARQIGGLGAIRRRGPVRRVTLIVGLNRGHSVMAARPECAQAPRRIGADRAVETFLTAREAQVGARSVGATVQPARGRWKGGGETTRIFDVLYRPSAKEPDFTRFRCNMLRLGETLAGRLCQDEVIAIVEDGRSKTEWTLTAEPQRRGRRRAK